MSEVDELELRIGEWISKFLAYSRLNHPDIADWYPGRIYFSPSVDNPHVIYPGMNPLPEDVDQKERERVFFVFEDYYRENPV
jgi:hypothetical protein